MPYKVRRRERNGSTCYELVNSETGRVHARCASRRNVERQKRLLTGLEEGSISRRKK